MERQKSSHEKVGGLGSPFNASEDEPKLFCREVVLEGNDSSLCAGFVGDRACSTPVGHREERNTKEGSRRDLSSGYFPEYAHE